MGRRVKLKNCPMCKGEARSYHSDTFGYGTCCTKCGLKLGGYASKGAATRAWNRRVEKVSYWYFDAGVDYCYRCKNCNEPAPFNAGFTGNQDLTPYCPYCGYEMRD